MRSNSCSITAVVLSVLALIVTLLTMPTMAQGPRHNVIYRQMHGVWMTLCEKDVMTDKVRCSLSARGPGDRSIIGGDHADLAVWSKDYRTSPAIAIFVPYVLVLDRGLDFRTDSGPISHFKCADIGGTQALPTEPGCIIKGADRDHLMKEWQNAQRVAIRGYLATEMGPTYVFDMNGYADALEDFLAVTKKYTG